MEASLVQSHVAGGRLYPRPKTTCDHCTKEVVLCWGEKITAPYWRHPAGTSDSHQAFCESATHKLAKKLLSEYLTGGGKCVYRHGCHSDLKIADEACVKFVEEYTYKDVRWDIACLDVEDCLLFGIEIRVTHVVNKITTRDEVPWVEVSANEVLTLLDKAETPREITLLNLSSTEPCCLRKFIVPRQITPDPPRAPLVVPRPKKTAPLLDFARHLGFLVETVPPHEILRRMAMQGQWVKRGHWQERGNSKTYQSEIAKEFLSRNKCLRCKRRYTTETCFKPYCGKCYHTIKNDDIYEEDTVEIEQTLKMQIREKMLWMSPIPSDWETNQMCMMCGKGDRQEIPKMRILTKEEEAFNPITGGNCINLTTWWFGEDKRICEICFETECRQRGLYELIPS